MITLKEATKKGKLKQFIKEHHSKDKPSDGKLFEATLSSMVRGTKKATPAASSQDDSEN